MLARIVLNVVSIFCGTAFTACLFLSIGHFLRAQEDATDTRVAPDDLELVTLALPPPPPPPKSEDTPKVDVPDLTQAIALGLTEEPSASPVKIAPSPPAAEELLPMSPPPAQVVAGIVNLDTTFKPSLDTSLDQNRIYQKSDVDKLPFPTSRPDLNLPRSTLGDAGRRSVIVLLVVDAHGAVGNVRILRSSNNAEFDAHIAEYIYEWEFSPAIKKGRPVRCMIQQQITVEVGHRDILSL
jgi:TonB family protein